MSKHTPGPWTLAKHSHTDIVTDGDAMIAMARDGLNGITRGQAVANARLIAAAPDLLEALRVGLFHTEKSAVRAKSLARWHNYGGMGGVADEYEREATESEQAAYVIRAIIAQATGQA